MVDIFLALNYEGPSSAPLPLWIHLCTLCALIRQFLNYRILYKFDWKVYFSFLDHRDWASIAFPLEIKIHLPVSCFSIFIHKTFAQTDRISKRKGGKDTVVTLIFSDRDTVVQSKGYGSYFITMLNLNMNLNQLYHLG